MISFKDLPEQSGDPHVFQPVYSGHYHQRTAGEKKQRFMTLLVNYYTNNKPVRSKTFES
jgi:hypothetical protein